MSESPSSPTPYHVSCSEKIRLELLSFADKAHEHGLEFDYLAGLKAIERLLRIYPQFGEPLTDLKLEPSQLWIGSVWPIVMRYTLDDQRRLVMIVAPFLLLPRRNA